MSCQRCGQPLAPDTPFCTNCGAPASLSPYAAPQPPRFSAGSLISDGDLPEWLREAPDGPSGAGAANAAPQAAWGGAPAARGSSQGSQGWAPPPAQPQPPQHDVSAQFTVRQPVIGQPGTAPQQPQQPQQPWPPQQPQQAWAQQQPGYGAPQQPPAFPPAYPQQPPAPSAYPLPTQSAYLQPPGYPQPTAYAQPPAYPQAPAGYGAPPAYVQPPAYPQPQAAPVNAFPGIEQAGAAYAGPPAGGMAGMARQSPLGQQAAPWLAGAHPASAYAPRPEASSGMQARSLVDDQALPKWLRDQPETAAHGNVSEWISASAAQEPMPQVLSDAYAQAPSIRPPQAPGSIAAPGVAPAPFGGYGGPDPSAAGYAPGGQPGGTDDMALPGWLRAQANAPAAGGQGGAADQEGFAAPSAGFAASDLIDPAALPAWVTGRAPAAQTFSSTHGWSAADGAEPQADGSAAYAPAAPAAEEPWDDAAWGGAEADDGARFAQRGAERSATRGRPLGAEELPPWLRGKGGRAAGAGRQQPERNPWAGAGEPLEAEGEWEDDAAWDSRGQPIPPMQRERMQAERAGAQAWGADDGAWNEAEDWSAAQDMGDDDMQYDMRDMRDMRARRDDMREMRGARDMRDMRDDMRDMPDPRESRTLRSASAGQEQDPLSGWGYADTGEQRRAQARQRRRTGGYSKRQGGYKDTYGGQYGSSYLELDPYDDGEPYDEEPEEEQRGRGFLGFLRRDKR